jgi:hypothetical protein
MVTATMASVRQFCFSDPANEITHMNDNTNTNIVPLGDSEAPNVDASGNTPKPPPMAKTLAEFLLPEEGDPTELFYHRFLCRGHGALFIGPTGIGKSTFILQSMMNWALGKEAFGIKPVRPLNFLMIQAENDDGDIAEMRDGVLTYGLDISFEEAAQAYQKIIIAREDTRAGMSFWSDVVRPLLKENKPDVLVIDPALAYLGGDTNSQEQVGFFLRNCLNPILQEFNCAAIIIHHSNKPPSGKQKTKWQAGDFAYLGAGSAEWGNWARAVIVLRSTGDKYVFELRLGKRGGRLRWKEADGETPSFYKYIAHDGQPGIICWHEVDQETAGVGDSKEEDAEERILAFIPSNKCKSKNSVIEQAQQAGIGMNKAREAINRLVERGILHESKEPRKGNKPAVYLAKFQQPEADSEPNSEAAPVFEQVQDPVADYAN